MSRFGKVGMFNQVGHPRIRGGLSPDHLKSKQQRGSRLEEFKTDEDTYFVPSFSIRRHLHRSEEELWSTERKLLQRRLGRGYETTPPSRASLKVVEQHRFIKNMRAAGIRPEPEQVRDLAYSIRDGLTDLLSSARSPIEIPLGNIGRYGYKENAIAYEIEGWRGERAQYASNDIEGFMDPLAVLLAERRMAVGAIALAFEGTDLRTDGIAPSPHITIARHRESIPDYRMRAIRGELTDVALSEVQLGDPIIELKLYRDEPSVSVPVRHAWESLATISDGSFMHNNQADLAQAEPYEAFDVYM